MKLFFEEQFVLLSEVVNENFSSSDTVVQKEGDLVVGFADDVTNFDPTIADFSTRERLLQIYEPLISFDADLRLQPSLAVSWGLTDDFTWDFRLRTGVIFHNGQGFSADDVVASFQRAKDAYVSQLKSLYTGIEIEKIDPYRIRFKTLRPDPLLPSKLTALLIFPHLLKDEQVIVPTGTGPYRFVSFAPGRELQLSRYDTYYGNKPYFENVLFRSIPDKDERKSALLRGEIDILAQVPPQFVQDLKDQQIVVKTLPNLEVSSLMFNFDSKIFAERDMRVMLTHILDRQQFITFGKGFTREANQFVSTGVFGYTLDIPPIEYNIEKAQALVRQYYPIEKPQISVGLPVGLNVIGDYLTNQLELAGFAVRLDYVFPEQLNDAAKRGEYDLYYLAWRSEMGDAGDFYQSVLHSRTDDFGTFNMSNYRSTDLDVLIEKSVHVLSPQQRLDIYRQIMKSAVVDQIVGIPLYASEFIYASRPKISLPLRVDGYLLMSDISHL